MSCSETSQPAQAQRVKFSLVIMNQAVTTDALIALRGRLKVEAELMGRSSLLFEPNSIEEVGCSFCCAVSPGEDRATKTAALGI